jgi:hypothetical protein
MSSHSNTDNSNMARRSSGLILSFLLRAAGYTALIFALLLVRLMAEVWFKGQDDVPARVSTYAGEALVAGLVMSAGVHLLTTAYKRHEQ